MVKRESFKMVTPVPDGTTADMPLPEPGPPEAGSGSIARSGLRRTVLVPASMYSAVGTLSYPSLFGSTGLVSIACEACIRL
jgi:hypothetical protein